jgi:hypothetical protein
LELLQRCQAALQCLLLGEVVQTQQKTLQKPEENEKILRKPSEKNWEKNLRKKGKT